MHIDLARIQALNLTEQDIGFIVSYKNLPEPEQGGLRAVACVFTQFQPKTSAAPQILTAH